MVWWQLDVIVVRVKAAPCNLRGQWSHSTAHSTPVQGLYSADKGWWPQPRAHLFSLLTHLWPRSAQCSVPASGGQSQTQEGQWPRPVCRHNTNPRHCYYDHTQSPHLWPIIWAHRSSAKYGIRYETHFIAYYWNLSSPMLNIGIVHSPSNNTPIRVSTDYLILTSPRPSSGPSPSQI